MHKSLPTVSVEVLDLTDKEDVRYCTLCRTWKDVVKRACFWVFDGKDALAVCGGAHLAYAIRNNATVK
jgi:hypothetical protein